jgi:hypothetical protein
LTNDPGPEIESKAATRVAFLGVVEQPTKFDLVNSLKTARAAKRLQDPADARSAATCFGRLLRAGWTETPKVQVLL